MFNVLSLKFSVPSLKINVMSLVFKVQCFVFISLKQAKHVRYKIQISAPTPKLPNFKHYPSCKSNPKLLNPEL